MKIVVLSFKIVHFFFYWKPGSNRTPALRTESEEAVRPHKFMQVGPHNSRSCRKGPQEATPRTRPPAPPPLGRRPQAAWSVHCTTPCPRTLVPAPSIKRISSSNPEGPLRDGCRRAAPPSTSGLFYPDTGLSWLLQPREIQHRRALHKVQHGLPRGPGQAWCSRLPGGVQCQGGHSWGTGQIPSSALAKMT